MTMLEIRNLSIRAGDTALVEQLDLSVARGGRVGLIGESGSGKSLTALAVMGLLAPGLRASGSVLLDGHEVVGAPERRLRHLRGGIATMVFQEPLSALDPLMRLGRQIEEPLRLPARRDGRAMTKAGLRAEAMALLNEVSLPDPHTILRAYPHEISGGQRQRVAIAMALACRPKILIADEPTTALDVTTQAEILWLLDRLVAARGMALLFISHDLPVVAGIARDVAVLRRGRLVETGRVTELFANPRHPYTAELVEAARLFERALAGAAAR